SPPHRLTARTPPSRWPRSSSPASMACLSPAVTRARPAMLAPSQGCHRCSCPPAADDPSAVGLIHTWQRHIITRRLLRTLLLADHHLRRRPVRHGPPAARAARCPRAAGTGGRAGHPAVASPGGVVALMAWLARHRGCEPSLEPIHY